MRTASFRSAADVSALGAVELFLIVEAAKKFGDFAGVDVGFALGFAQRGFDQVEVVDVEFKLGVWLRHDDDLSCFLVTGHIGSGRLASRKNPMFSMCSMVYREAVSFGRWFWVCSKDVRRRRLLAASALSGETGIAQTWSKHLRYRANRPMKRASKRRLQPADARLEQGR